MSEDGNTNSDTQQQIWQLIEEHFRSGKPLVMQVVEATQKKWLVELGDVRGIVEQPYVYGYTRTDDEQPLTLEELLKRHLENMRGQSIKLKVIEVDRSRNHLILSQQLYTEEERKAMRIRQEQMLRELQPGDIRKGIVTSLTKRSIKVDIDGVRGWIPRGLFALDLITDAHDVVSIGQEIEVMVLENAKSSVTLSLIHAQQRDAVLETIQLGQICTARIQSLSSEGAYVDLGCLIGLVPASQIVHGYITHPADVFHRAQEVVVRVEQIDDNKKVMLSLIEAH